MSGDHVEEQVQGPGSAGSGFSRREALKRGAIVGGAVVWATPMVQGIGLTKMSAAVASHGAVHGCCAGASGYDVLATFTGPVTGDAGPVRSGSGNFSDCFSNMAVTAPSKSDPFVTAALTCVTTTSDPCRADVDITDVAVDLLNVHELMDVQLNLSLIDAEAQCDCGAGCTRGSCIATATGSATLTYGTTTIDLKETAKACPDANHTIPFAVADVLVGSLVLNEQPAGTCAVNAIHLTVETDPKIFPKQTVDVIVGHAEAACTA